MNLAKQIIAVVAKVNGIGHLLNAVEITDSGQSSDIVFKNHSKLPGYDSEGNEILMDVHPTWHSSHNHLAIYLKENNVEKVRRRYFFKNQGPSLLNFKGESYSWTWTHLVKDINYYPEILNYDHVIEVVHINLDKITAQFIGVRLTLLEKGLTMGDFVHYSLVYPNKDIYLFRKTNYWIRLEISIDC